jgi:hypothetical protein
MKTTETPRSMTKRKKGGMRWKRRFERRTWRRWTFKPNVHYGGKILNRASDDEHLITPPSRRTKLKRDSTLSRAGLVYPRNWRRYQGPNRCVAIIVTQTVFSTFDLTNQRELIQITIHKGIIQVLRKAIIQVLSEYYDSKLNFSLKPR